MCVDALLREKKSCIRRWIRIAEIEIEYGTAHYIKFGSSARLLLATLAREHLY
jgi:hypothetical protein